jgi:hypothetical protein
MTIRERIAKMREEIQAREQMGQSNSQEQKKNTEAVEEKKTEKASEQKMSTRERIANTTTLSLIWYVPGESLLRIMSSGMAKYGRILCLRISRPLALLPLMRRLPLILA